MDERRKVAFDFARDSTKQLLTLSTAVLTGTVALATAFDDRIDGDVRVYLKAVWRSI